jgi:two-component system, NarL family, sensor histidine kinase DegS
MTTETNPSPAPTVAAEVETLERELHEIDMLIQQARTEAERHEHRRTQAASKLATTTGQDTATLTELSNQLVTLTRRAALMEAQVDVLEGKHKALSRFRDSLARHAATIEEHSRTGFTPAPADPETGQAPLPPGVSRIVLSAQEDLRRDIARAMHDGPAQSLTNIVLQAQIVERLIASDPPRAANEVRLLISMVQQTLDATKSFIFDVRPMVLDDLGLLPTLRRAARDRGQRAGLSVEFESLGADRRLPVELESGLFRILDRALAGYLAGGPDSVALRLDWGDEVEAIVSATRQGGSPPPSDGAPQPEPKRGKDLPPALAAMMDERHEDERAAAEAARNAAIVTLPPATWREIRERAATLGVTVELRDGGGTLRVATPAELASGTARGS